MGKRTKNKVTIILDDKKWKKIEKEIKKLDKAFTATGFHGGEINPEGDLISDYAYRNEFGAGYVEDTRIRMPERSFMRAWFDQNKQKIKDLMEDLFHRVVAGQLTAETAMKLLGEFAEGGIKEFLTDLKNPPNAPITIKKKKSSNPLIDQGSMRSAIKHREGRGEMPK